MMFDFGQNKEARILAAKIASALRAENGKALLAWLRSECYMENFINPGGVDNAAFVQYVNARRDLFIKLEQLAKEGAHVTVE